MIVNKMREKLFRTLLVIIVPIVSDVVVNMVLLVARVILDVFLPVAVAIVTNSCTFRPRLGLYALLGQRRARVESCICEGAVIDELRWVTAAIVLVVLLPSVIVTVGGLTLFLHSGLEPRSHNNRDTQRKVDIRQKNTRTLWVPQLWFVPRVVMFTLEAVVIVELSQIVQPHVARLHYLLLGIFVVYLFEGCFDLFSDLLNLTHLLVHASVDISTNCRVVVVVVTHALMWSFKCRRRNFDVELDFHALAVHCSDEVVMFSHPLAGLLVCCCCGRWGLPW